MMTTSSTLCNLTRSLCCKDSFQFSSISISKLCKTQAIFSKTATCSQRILAQPGQPSRARSWPRTWSFRRKCTETGCQAILPWLVTALFHNQHTLLYIILSRARSQQYIRAMKRFSTSGSSAHSGDRINKVLQMFYPSEHPSLISTRNILLDDWAIKPN